MGEEDLWREFMKWGSVREVFIPQKKDKYGRRFGFVRFKAVDNVKWLEDQLGSM